MSASVHSCVTTDAYLEYIRARTTEALAAAFTAAPTDGIVMLKRGEGEYHLSEAKHGAYDFDDLLVSVPFGLETAIKVGEDLSPEWLAWDQVGNFFQFTDADFCRAYIRKYDLRRHKGEYYKGEEAVTQEEVKQDILRTMLIVRGSSAEDKTEKLLRKLKTYCPDDEPVGRKKQLTYAEACGFLKDHGYSIKLNLITQQIEVNGTTESGRPMTPDDITIAAYDGMAEEYKGVSFVVLERYLDAMARDAEYNPVLDLLDSTPWDGADRYSQLYDLLGIADDVLSCELLQNWLRQTIALLFNDPRKPFGADGILVLNGKQGYGKTSFFRHLAVRPEWFGEGESISDFDKDTRRRTLTRWISELGEVENTLRKADLDGLKSFITGAEDAYRLPYGRHDIVTPRRTSLCATCNNGKFLLDQTGNRRWWSIPLEKRITRADLEQLDALQLWAQVYGYVSTLPYDEKAACFRLSPRAMEALTERNAGFEKAIRAEDEILDILADADRKGYEYKDMTISTFKDNYDILRPYTAEQIGAALKKIGLEQRRTKAGRFYSLPWPVVGWQDTIK